MNTESAIKAAAQSIVHHDVPRSKRGASLFAIVKFLVVAEDDPNPTVARVSEQITRLLRHREEIRRHYVAPEEYKTIHNPRNSPLIVVP